MKARELCIREVAIVSPGASVLDAARCMREQHVGDLVVVEGEPGKRRPVGMLTDRDLVLDVMAPAEADPATTPVASVMKRELVTAGEGEDASTVLERMRASGVRRVPIVDAGGYLVGILTHDDLLEWVAEEATMLARVAADAPAIEARRRPPIQASRPARRADVPMVRDVMTDHVTSTIETASVSSAVDLLAELDVRHLPVVNEDGELVGMLSDRDLAGQGFRTESPVTSLMSPHVVLAGLDDDLASTIELMLEARVGAVPVVDAERHVVGILSYVDALRCYQRELDEASAAPRP